MTAPTDQPTPKKTTPAKDEQTVNVGNFERRFKPQLWQLAVFGVIFGSLGIYTLFLSFASPHNSPTATPAPPLSFTQSWQARYPDRGLNTGCFGVDDRASWQGSGTLAPGATYTFTPSDPTCRHSEIPMIAMHVSWSGSTQIKLETTNPFAAAQVDTNSNGPFHTNLHEIAPVTADANANQQANLCMWTNADLTAYAEGLITSSTDTTDYHIPWTMTLTNTGTQTATITASGYEANGWIMNLFPGCRRADGDSDHWNDSLEMVMQYLTESVGGAADARTAYQGSDYVAASGTAAANDEIDFSPADFNDDGVINQTDVNTISSYVGQGDSVSIDQISPNNTDSTYVNNEIKVWRRYDLDGDGLVTQHDIDWVKTLVGQPLPLTSDVLSPWAVIHANTISANTAQYIYAYAADNDLLTHVDFYSTISGKQKLLCQSWGPDAPANVPNASNDEYSCSITAPRQTGTPVVLTVKAYDNAGNSYTTSKTLTTQ